VLTGRSEGGPTSSVSNWRFERRAPNRGGQPRARAPRAYPRSPQIFRAFAPSREQNSGARRVGFHELSGPSGLVFVGERKDGSFLVGTNDVGPPLPTPDLPVNDRRSALW